VNVDYRPNLLLVKKLEDAGFDGTDVAEIIRIINSLCHDCWDTDIDQARCYCSDDV
jgi:hypothetical protein